MGAAARFDAVGSMPLVRGAIDLVSLADGTIGSVGALPPCFAVFDGMGGEQQGEVASRIAAETLENIYVRGSQPLWQGNPATFLEDACQRMNDAVCAYAQENAIRRMGTTAVLLVIEGQTVYVCNLGDSRAYFLKPSSWFKPHRLEQVSRDHSQSGVSAGKAPLTQYVGIPRDEFIIEPFIARLPLQDKVRWLLCTDGLTDMVSEQAITKTLAAGDDIGACANSLLEAALGAGGRDNITIIICETRKGSGR
jgi:protein phosphatase